MLTDNQNRNFQFFERNLPSLLADPLKQGKYAVVYNEAITGIFDSFAAAYGFACAEYADNNFIIQQVIDQSDVVQFLRMAVV